jgi:class 3 adenylate cyclase/tetratricopeptide (TPR) repeat protein
MAVARGPERRSRGRSAAPFSDKAERRQLTIMFCDLVDSVRLSVQLDPEDLRDLIGAYQHACAEAVERYNGYVARHVGDGVLIYFGFPVAHEDNAERAVRAALDLVEAVAELAEGHFAELDVEDIELKVRVGIATGLVVVGGPDEGIDHNAVVGEAANLAARLQGLADPNTVVVSDSTRQLAAESFAWRDRGKHELKGFAEPVAVWQAIGRRDVTRLEARGPALSAFVGRQEEIDLLLDRWARSAGRTGQVVALVGPAGMGKSRVVAEVLERIRQDDPATPVATLQCSPYHANTPLYPIVRYLTRQAGIEASDATTVKLEKVARLFKEDPARGQKVPLIAELLGIELSPDHPAFVATQALAPFVRRRLTIEALRDWFANLGTPAVILVEDAQWIDPTSRLLLGRLGQWTREAAALIAITLRADKLSGADELLKETGLAEADGRYADHVTVREIRELSVALGRKLAAEIAAGEEGALAAPQLEAIVARSGGIPLYLEQLVKAAVGGFDVARRHVPQRAQDDRVGAVPATIDDALMAQLDRLGAAKEVAQHAAVIGPEFQVGLLARIMARSAEDLAPQLRDLEQSRIVERTAAEATAASGDAASDSYRFRHSLIQDISYRSLLRKNRRQIHLLVAGELSGHRAGEGAANDDFIAQHYALGDSPLQAIEFWRRGSGEAIGRSANEEALGMLEQALAAVASVRGGVGRDLELDLVLSRAMALRSVRGYSAPEVEQALTRAKELCDAAGDANSRFSVGWGLFQCMFVKGDIQRARDHALELLETAGDDPSPALVDALLASGMVSFDAGEFEAARKFFETGASLCRPEYDQPRFLTHGQNPGLFCLSFLARAECNLGQMQQAQATIERALSIAAQRSQDSGHTHSALNVTIQAVRVYHLCGDLGAEKRLAEELVAVARRNQYAYYEALGTCHIGWVAALDDELDRGIAILNEGIAALKRTGTSLALPGYYLLLAQLYVRAGRLHDATHALALAADATGHVWDAEIERVRGDIAAADWQAAEAAYRASLATARAQGAGLFMCKAGLSLAQLLASRGRRQEACQVLEECLVPLSADKVTAGNNGAANRNNGGDDVAVVRQVRTMLSELSA